MKKIVATAVIAAAVFVTPAGVAGAAPAEAPVVAAEVSVLDTGSGGAAANAVCALLLMLKLGSVDSSGGPKCASLS